MQLIHTYILSTIANYHASTLIEQNQDILFLHTGYQYACGVNNPDLDAVTSEDVHKEEVKDSRIVPVLRTVSQKITDYKKQQGD